MQLLGVPGKVRYLHTVDTYSIKSRSQMLCMGFAYDRHNECNTTLCQLRKRVGKCTKQQEKVGDDKCTWYSIYTQFEQVHFGTQLDFEVEK